MAIIMNYRNVLLVSLLFIYSFAYSIEVKDIKCNNIINPSGVITPYPFFSWTYIGDDKSPKQGGYRILMATSLEKLKYPDIWDTGPTSTSKMGPFKYRGAPL